jgi:hypothetical protein
LRKLPLLTGSGLTYAGLNSLSYLWVEDNARLDGYDMLKSAFEGNSPLNNIRVIGFDKAADDDDTVFLLTLANGSYHGIDADGERNNNIPPVLFGTVNYDTIDGDVYDALKAAYGNNLTVNYNFITAYIKIADAEVKRILLLNGVGDGTGITKIQAESLTSISTWFKGNVVIRTFNELPVFVQVTSLAESAFNGCTALESIDLTNIKTIGNNAFYDCAALFIEDLKTPSLTSWGNNSFYGVKIRRWSDMGNITSLLSNNSSASAQPYGDPAYLQSIVIPPTVTEIPQYAFYKYNALTSVTATWSSITKIQSAAFRECTSLVFDDLRIPNLTTLVANAFYGVKIKKWSDMGKLTELPSAIASSQNYGDKECLEEVTIPATCTSIASNSFNGYVNMRAIKVLATSPPTLVSANAFNNTNSCPIYVPDDSVAAYKVASNWSASSVINRIYPLSQYNG